MARNINSAPQLSTAERGIPDPRSFERFNRLLTDTDRYPTWPVLGALHEMLGGREISQRNELGTEVARVAGDVVRTVADGTALGFAEPWREEGWGMLYSDADYREARAVYTATRSDAALARRTLVALAICVEAAAHVDELSEMAPPAEVVVSTLETPAIHLGQGVVHLATATTAA